MSKVYLACEPGVRGSRIFTQPKIYLAHAPGAQGDNVLKNDDPSIRLAWGYNQTGKALDSFKDVRLPSVLISFVYLKKFLSELPKYNIRDWVLDSGAFSAWKSGSKIDLNEYIETCKNLMAEDTRLIEIFALDVIGDWKASLKNCEKMWEAGVKAIPTFHINEPEDVLLEMAKTYPKIAIGGVALKRGDVKFSFAKQVFARVWPKKIHGFGFGSERHIMGLPFHSVDATNWEIGPCKYGRWQAFGKMSVRGSKQDLRGEIKFYLDLEDKARARWAKEMALLE